MPKAIDEFELGRIKKNILNAQEYTSTGLTPHEMGWAIIFCHHYKWTQVFEPEDERFTLTCELVTAIDEDLVEGSLFTVATGTYEEEYWLLFTDWSDVEALWEENLEAYVNEVWLEEVPDFVVNYVDTDSVVRDMKAESCPSQYISDDGELVEYYWESDWYWMFPKDSR